MYDTLKEISKMKIINRKSEKNIKVFLSYLHHPFKFEIFISNISKI